MTYKKTTLKNGLRILTVPAKNTEAATVLVLVKAGSKYETKDINGISHFLEHMLFKGTQKRPSTLKLIEPLDRVGGRYNAFTSQEYTGYWAKVRSTHLDLVLDWISDIYFNSKFDEKEISRERGTILQEMNMVFDDPARYVYDLWGDLLYGDQPAGWRVIGTADVIKGVKREQMVDYLKNRYLARNTIVVVAGQIEPGAAIEKVKKYFAPIVNRKIQDKSRVLERQDKPRALIHWKETDQTHLILGCRACNIFHPDYYTLTVLGEILGGYMSSRLFISVRERQGLAYYISAGADCDTDTGVLVANAGVDNQKAEKAIATILREFGKMKEKKVGVKELAKAKDHIQGGTSIAMESSHEQASFFGFQELLTDKILTLEEKFAKIDAVTADDILRVADGVFQPAKLNLALIGPFKDKTKFEKILKL